MGRFLTTIFHLTPQHHKCYIFLETSVKIKFNGDDPNHHDHHQEPQEYGGCHPSMRRFLTTIFHLTPPQLGTSINICININSNFRFSEDDPSHQDHYQEPQEKEVPDNHFPLNTLCIIDFWKPRNLKQNQVK